MESNESDEKDREEPSDQSSDEKTIIDEPFSREQMPQFVGDFAQYLKNITELLFFYWMEKHVYIVGQIHFFWRLNDKITYYSISLPATQYKHMTN